MIKKVCYSFWKLGTALDTRIETKKMHHVVEFNQSQWVKLYIEFNTQKRIETEKMTDGKALYKLTNNAIYRKTKENLGNRIIVKLVNNKKNYLKCTSKPSCILRKIFGINLVVIRKSKLALKLN